MLVLRKHFHKDRNVHRQHKGPCDVCEIISKRTPQADVLSRLCLFLPSSSQTIWPMAPHSYVTVLPGRRFGLLYNEKMKLKGVPENVKKWFKLKTKNSHTPQINSSHKHHGEQQNNA